MGGRPRRLLGPTVGSAAVLAVCALVLWGVALWVSWGGSCPNSSATTGGLDKGISVWPPAAQCTNANGGTFWHQALPWATWVIGALILIAAAVLLTGLIVAIRRALPWATWVIGALILIAAAVLLTGLIVAIRDLSRTAPAADVPAR